MKLRTQRSLDTHLERIVDTHLERTVDTHLTNLLKNLATAKKSQFVLPLFMLWVIN